MTSPYFLKRDYFLSSTYRYNMIIIRSIKLAQGSRGVIRNRLIWLIYFWYVPFVISRFKDIEERIRHPAFVFSDTNTRMALGRCNLVHQGDRSQDIGMTICMEVASFNNLSIPCHDVVVWCSSAFAISLRTDVYGHVIRKCSNISKPNSFTNVRISSAPSWI